MNQTTVYLAGLISTIFPESLRWRDEVTPILTEAGFYVLSPMRGKENLVTTSPDGGLTDCRLTSRDIILRDFNDVKNSDVVLAHLEDFGSPRPLIGTLFELAWAWQMQKPVVAVIYPCNLLMRSHPFIKETTTHVCEDLDEAVDFITTQCGR